MRLRAILDLASSLGAEGDKRASRWFAHIVNVNLPYSPGSTQASAKPKVPSRISYSKRDEIYEGWQKIPQRPPRWSEEVEGLISDLYALSRLEIVIAEKWGEP